MRAEEGVVGRRELDAGDELLTADEVAGLLRVTTGWVYRETRAGRIPHVPLGRYRRYRRATILRWLARLEEQSLAPATVSHPRFGSSRKVRA